MPASLFEKIWLFRMMPFPLPRTTMPERRPWWIWLHCKWTWDTTEDRSDMPERSRVLNHLPTAAPGWTQWRKQHPRKIPSTRRSAWTLLLPCPSCTGAHLGTYQGESEGRSVHCPASWDIVMPALIAEGSCSSLARHAPGNRLSLQRVPQTHNHLARPCLPGSGEPTSQGRAEPQYTRMLAKCSPKGAISREGWEPFGF